EFSQPTLIPHLAPHSCPTRRSSDLPATHGVLRLITTLEGEIVRDVKPIMGYVHTGIEKTCEDKSYWKVIPVIERMDYLAYYFNRSEEHTSELQSRENLVCRLLLEKK